MLKALGIVADKCRGRQKMPSGRRLAAERDNVYHRESVLTLPVLFKGKTFDSTVYPPADGPNLE